MLALRSLRLCCNWATRGTGLWTGNEERHSPLLLLDPLDTRHLQRFFEAKTSRHRDRTAPVTFEIVNRTKR